MRVRRYEYRYESTRVREYEVREYEGTSGQPPFLYTCIELLVMVSRVRAISVM